MKAIICAAAAGALFVGATTAHAAFVGIDAYDQAQTIISVNGPHPSNDVVQLGLGSAAVGGNREMTLTRDSADPAITSSGDGAIVRVGGDVDTLSYSSALGITGTLTLTYGSLADLNMNMSSTDGILVGGIGTAGQTLSFDVTFTSAGSTVTTAAPTPMFTFSGSLDAVQVPFPVGTVTSDVDKIVLTFHPSAGQNFVLEEPVGSHVPEPASLGLLGLGAVALLRRRR